MTPLPHDQPLPSGCDPTRSRARFRPPSGWTSSTAGSRSPTPGCGWLPVPTRRFPPGRSRSADACAAICPLAPAPAVGPVREGPSCVQRLTEAVPLLGACTVFRQQRERLRAQRRERLPGRVPQLLCAGPLVRRDEPCQQGRGQVPAGQAADRRRDEDVAAAPGRGRPREARVPPRLSWLLRPRHPR